MKKNLLVIFSFALIIFFSCSKDDPTGPDLYTPQLPNQWLEENVPTHALTLQSEDDGLNQGLFTGTEEYPDSNYFGSPITGFFVNHDIEFNIDRSQSNGAIGTKIKYRGTIVSANRIELNTPKGKLGSH